MSKNYYDISELVGLLEKSSFGILQESFIDRIKIPKGVKVGEIASVFGVILSDNKPDITVKIIVPVLVDISKSVTENQEMAEDHGLPNEIWASMFSAMKIVDNGESRGTFKLKVSSGLLLESERVIESEGFHIINPNSIYMFPQELKDKTVSDYGNEIPVLIMDNLRLHSLLKVYDHFLNPQPKAHEVIYDDDVVENILKNHNVDKGGIFRDTSGHTKSKKTGYLHRVSGLSSLPSAKVVMQRILDSKEPTANMAFMYGEMKRLLDIDQDESLIMALKTQIDVEYQANRSRLRNIKYQLITENKAEPAEFQYNYLGKDYIINLELEVEEK